MKKNIIISIVLAFMINIGVSQKVDHSFFTKADDFFAAHVSDGLIDYGALIHNPKLKALIHEVSIADVSGLDDATKQAFYINAYNLNVIQKIVEQYPIGSVMEKNGFFDKDKIKVAHASLTLNQLEKDKLLKTYKDARFHFVLVCGALGCPPITNFAYQPDQLETQLNQQTKRALNDSNFIKYSSSSVQLSEIFKWYAKDFGSNSKQILDFINAYRDVKIPSSSKIKYYQYDWTLNAIQTDINSTTSSNASRYIVSSTIPKGSVELKIFNNLYSQQTGDEVLSNRSSFFTTSLSAFYGLSNRVNIGISTRYRKVRNNPLPSSPFSVFGNDAEHRSRAGITAIGPQIRYAPVPKWSNFSIQSAFVFPIGSDLAGNTTQPYIDWTGPTWNTQFFNDFSIGQVFSLFTEIDVLIEDIGSTASGHLNRVSTPVTAIFSYIPTRKLTLYTLGGYSPYWQSSYDYFYQYGFGSKYQFTPELEVEILYTDFSNKFLIESNGKAETINLGLRINF